MNKKDGLAPRSAKLLPVKKVAKKPRGKGKPFAKGDDPRRNLKGRGPRTSGLLKDMVLDVFGEIIEAPDPTKPGTIEKVSTLYYMIRRMALGKAPADHTELLGRGYGPLATVTRNESDLDEFFQNNWRLFTKGQLQRVVDGEPVQVVISELLKEVLEEKRKIRK